MTDRLSLGDFLEKELLDETCDLLSRLIQNKCVNPPGDEIKSIKTISDHLKKYGIEAKIYESNPSRGNLVAKISGSDKNHPGLIFGPSHVDVVPVTKPEEWQVDPFSGELKDNHIWGRGAFDMLFMVATQVQAFIQLKKEGFQPKGDLILFIVADEETGGKFGAKWMLDNHPEEVGLYNKEMFAVTESGGIPFAPNRMIFLHGEKGSMWTCLKFKGTPGHGSYPYGSDNAILKSSEAALKLTDYCDNKMPVDTQYIRNLIKGVGINFILRKLITNKFTLPFMLKILKKTDPQMATVMHSLTRMTISPNVIKGGSKTNIIPAEVLLNLDVRTLPGQDFEYVKFHIRRALGSLADEVEINQLLEEGFFVEGTVSPPESLFVDAMNEAVQKEFPDSKLVPMLSMGGTDARFYRMKNVEAYGFALYDPELKLGEIFSMSHGIDEKIGLKTIDLSLKVFYNLAKGFLV